MQNNIFLHHYHNNRIGLELHKFYLKKFLLNMWRLDGRKDGISIPLIQGKNSIDYLTKGKDPIETIVESNNLMDFVINCKKGPGFYKVVHIIEPTTKVISKGK